MKIEFWGHHGASTGTGRGNLLSGSRYYVNLSHTRASALRTRHTVFSGLLRAPPGEAMGPGESGHLVHYTEEKEQKGNLEKVPI